MQPTKAPAATTMHEMSIAIDMLRQIEQLASEHKATRVDRIELDIGVLRQIVPEALHDAFTALAEGTVADGAVLEMTEVPARALCTDCDTEYPVAIDEYLCPQCHLANARILSGDDIIIKSLECQTDSNGAAHED